MPRFIQKIVLVCCLSLAARSGFAFSLLGVVEGWQIPAIGHNEPGDIGAVKSIGQEYRWNVPIITYGFDNSFLNYFGANGVAAVDGAFDILNSLPPFSQIDTNLSEFSLLDPATGTATTFRDSRRENPRARANGLIDLKSTTLSLVLEQLGLAVPERFVWTLRERRTVGTPPQTNYTVIMRNFDPVTFAHSPYVNGTRYTYQILEDNQANADAFEIPVDPESSFSSVASPLITPGVFFTHLTRDDIGGLRYLYSPANLNFEPFSPNTEAYTLDTGNLIQLVNLDLTQFSLLSRSVSPETLSNLYPGLLITGVTPTGSTVVSNVPVLITNRVPLIFFTNRSQHVIISNIDLTSFASFTRTNPPAAVLAAFPNLSIASTNTLPVTEVQIQSIVLTNAPRDPWDDPFTTRFIFQTNYTTNLVLNYFYSFRNVITNYFSPLNQVRREITGLDREPWSDASNPIYRTNVQTYIVAEPSGGVVIVPTNLIGYEFTEFAITNVFGTTNILLQTNFIDPNTFLPRFVQDVEIRFFTNVQYATFPIEILPAGQFTNIVITNSFTTNLVTTFDTRVGNVTTNYFGPITPITRYRYTINPSTMTTNRTVTEEVLPVPSGGFLIDTNLTGFVLTGPQIVSIISITNVLFDITNPGTGERHVEEFVYNFTNTTYQAVAFVLTPAPPVLLRGGVDKITFRRLGSGTIAGNVFNHTNRYKITYYTNGFPVEASFQVTQTRPDILFVAGDLGVSPGDIGVPVRILRNGAFQNNAALDSLNPANQGGPGTVIPPIDIQFSNVGPDLFNSFPGFTTEASVLQNFVFGGINFIWGSFDGSTNPPIVYPQDITLEEIENRTAGLEE
jgi:hypothetical protein